MRPVGKIYIKEMLQFSLKMWPVGEISQFLFFICDQLEQNLLMQFFENVIGKINIY